MWRLGLGDFVDNNLHNKNSYLPWSILILSTFFSNIVFLNMLISIMGDTLQRMRENSERIGMSERTSLYADFIHTF